jgi:hypothetical protein
MDINSIIIVSLIVSAFVLFASVLMYGDIASRQARRAQATKRRRWRPRRPSSNTETQRSLVSQL